MRAQLLWFTLLFFRILAVCVYSVRGTGGWPMPALCKKWQYALRLAQIICKSLIYKEKVSVFKCIIVTWYLKSLAWIARNKNKTRWLWLYIYYLSPIDSMHTIPYLPRSMRQIFLHIVNTYHDHKNHCIYLLHQLSLYIAPNICLRMAHLSHWFITIKYHANYFLEFIIST